MRKCKKNLKKTSKKKLEEILPNGITFDMVDLWVQDEARFGQQGKTSRMWCEKGTRPRAIKQLQFINAYIFGAVCPSKGLAAAIIVPYIGIVAMQAHLNEISKKVPLGRHAVIIVDRAAWHMGKNLDIPKNISLLPQPPYSPELNSCEQIWQYLRDHYLSNRSFDGYEDILNAVAKAWNKFVSLPERITSLCSRSWMVC
jgi:DDE superfamily endonuclease